MSTAENDAVELSAADMSWLDSLPEGESSVDHESQVAPTTSKRMTSSWDIDAIDIAEVFKAVSTGTFKRMPTTIMPRTDGACLFYPHSVNSIYGASGSGKSWGGMAVVAWCLKNGMTALYIDVEDRPETASLRLMQLGVTLEQIEAGFKYMRPDAAYTASKKDAAAWSALLKTHRFDVVLVDSYNVMLTKWGLSPMEVADINTFMDVFAFQLADTGACVIFIDHIGKGSETNKGFQYGSQAKKSTVTGCTYYVEAKEKAAPGRMGEIRMYVAKDRHGTVEMVSAESGDEIRHTATMLVDGVTDVDKVDIRFIPWNQNSMDDFLDQSQWDLHRRVYEFVGQKAAEAVAAGTATLYPSIREIRESVKGGNNAIGDAVNALLKDGVLINHAPMGLTMQIDIGPTPPPWLVVTPRNDPFGVVRTQPVDNGAQDHSTDHSDEPGPDRSYRVGPGNGPVQDRSASYEEVGGPGGPQPYRAGDPDQPTDESPASGWNDIHKHVFAFVTESIDEKRSKGTVCWWPSLDTIVENLPYDEDDVVRAVNELLDACLLFNGSPNSSIEQFDVGFMAPPPWLEQPVIEPAKPKAAEPDLFDWDAIS